jgi:hypothetical protein
MSHVHFGASRMANIIAAAALAKITLPTAQPAPREETQGTAFVRIGYF